MVLRTISAARSHAARSAPGHAATWVGIAAMPSWASPKPAPGTVWRSGTISAAGSRSPGTLSFRHCRNSSAAADSQPDTHGCPRFCRYYDAGQFEVGQHALCWVHAERLVHKLDTFTEPHRAAQQKVRKLIWNFYADLKAYKANPDKRRRLALRARFDRIFRRRTGFATLDRLLARLHANKAELLMVLERPEIPLHTNGSENDIRCQVTRRKVSAGTRSDLGRDCRDAFLGLAKTCARHGVAFWDYLGSRLKVPGHLVVPPLSELVRCRGQPA